MGQTRPDRDRGRLGSALLGAYVFLLPVQLAAGADLRVAVSDLLVVAYVLLVPLRLGRTRPAWTPWYPALLVVMGTGLLVTLLNTGTLTTYAFVQKGIGLVVLLLSMACVVDHMRTVAQLRFLLRAFLAGVLVNVVLALAAYAAQQVDPNALPQVNYAATRLSGLLVDPNAFGGLVACALVLHLFTAGTPVATVPARFQLSTTVLLAVALVLTISRSAWIAAATGIATAVVAGGARALRATAPVLVGTAVLAPLAAITLLPDLGRLAGRQSQVDGRVDLIDHGLDAFAESPLWGIGVGVFPERHDEIVHNTALWFLAETGLVGLVVFLGLVISFALRMVRLLPHPDPQVRTLALALLSAHAAMLGLSLGIEALYQRHWWLVLGLGAALQVIAARTSERPPRRSLVDDDRRAADARAPAAP